MKKSILLTTSAIVMGLLTGAAYADTIRFLTTEYQPDRVAKQQAMAADFEKQPDIPLKLFRLKRKILGSCDCCVCCRRYA